MVKYIRLSILLIITLFVLNNVIFAQHADTFKIVSPSKSPFGVMEIPAELMDVKTGQDAEILGFRKFSLKKDYTEEYKKYGLKRPDINLHLENYSFNPAKELHPVVYAALIVGAFFNNRIMTIQEEQYRMIMNNMYDYPTSASRYGMTQYNLSKGVFGSTGVVVSGYRTFIPTFAPNINPVSRGSAVVNDPAKR